MSDSLRGAVGSGGRNLRDDVVKVQTLLVARGFVLGKVDGICGYKTLTAIRAFQSGFMRVPDGRIDPAGLTWKKLSGAAPAPDTQSAFLELLPRPTPGSVNVGLIAAGNAYMVKKLGQPRSSYSADCQPVTNTQLKQHFTSAMVGPLHVQGFSPAVDSLREVFADIAREQPGVYTLLGTAGMLCCRLQRGSSTKISNHSWGTAIDLTIAKVLDQRGDGKVQYGLTLIAPIFNRHGWYWGGAFPVEDGMHFEASQRLIELWAAGIGGTGT
jgi:hypothetical protein